MIAVAADHLFDVFGVGVGGSGGGFGFNGVAGVARLVHDEQPQLVAGVVHRRGHGVVRTADGVAAQFVLELLHSPV